MPRLTPCCPSCGLAIKDGVRVEKLAKEHPSYKKHKEEIERKKRNGKNVAAFEDDVLDVGTYVTEEEIWQAKKKEKKLWCLNCGGALWQMSTSKEWAPKTVLRGDDVEALPLPDDLKHLPPTIKDTSFRRFSVADYIKKFHSGFFKLLISDEIHQGKEGTAIDFARRALMS